MLKVVAMGIVMLAVQDGRIFWERDVVRREKATARREGRLRSTWSSGDLKERT